MSFLSLYWRGVSKNLWESKVVIRKECKSPRNGGPEKQLTSKCSTDWSPLVLAIARILTRLYLGDGIGQGLDFVFWDVRSRTHGWNTDAGNIFKIKSNVTAETTSMPCLPFVMELGHDSNGAWAGWSWMVLQVSMFSDPSHVPGFPRVQPGTSAPRGHKGELWKPNS